MRLTSASMGQDLTWLLRDAGPTVPLEAARRAVLAATGAVVTQWSLSRAARRSTPST
jgi:hypothetical protein